MATIIKMTNTAAEAVNRLIERKATGLLSDRRAEGNLIATVLIIIVVIALAAIFREKIFDLIGRLFVRIDDEVGGF